MLDMEPYYPGWDWYHVRDIGAWQVISSYPDQCLYFDPTCNLVKWKGE